MPNGGREYQDTLLWLWRSGLRFGALIDAGCADGQVSVVLAELGPTRGSAILNIDAQDDYVDSLERIRAALGGHYRVCAVGERDGGTIVLHRGEHAYWSSVRPPGDRYWATLNDLVAPAPAEVPLRTLDSLVAETALPAPYLLKLDIQGAEAAALAGATETLGRTSVVAVEVMVDDFIAIHEVLARRGFGLIDVTSLRYSQAGNLGWFYAVYLAEPLRAQLPAGYWDASGNEENIALQHRRREEVRAWIEDALERLRAGQWATPDPAG